MKLGDIKVGDHLRSLVDTHLVKRNDEVVVTDKVAGRVYLETNDRNDRQFWLYPYQLDPIGATDDEIKQAKQGLMGIVKDLSEPTMEEIREAVDLFLDELEATKVAQTIRVTDTGLWYTLIAVQREYGIAHQADRFTIYIRKEEGNARDTSGT